MALEETIVVTITGVVLTHDAQRAEILAGRSGERGRSIVVSGDDPAFAEVVALGQVDDDGHVTLRAGTEYSWHEWDHVPTAAEVAAHVRAEQAAAAAREAAKLAERHAETLAVLRERRTREEACYSPVYYRRVMPDWPYQPHQEVVESPEAIEWVRELDAENERRLAAALAQKAATEQAEAEAKAEKERRNAEYEAAAADLVRQVGTPDQIGRLDDSVLPAEERDQIVRDFLFAPLAGVARYEKLRAADVEHAEDCCGDVSFEAVDAAGLPTEPWQRLREIRALMPTAVCTPRLHTGTCESCDGSVARYSVRVAVDWHGKRHTREYAA